jgi:hypothetical protein
MKLDALLKRHRTGQAAENADSGNTFDYTTTQQRADEKV